MADLTADAQNKRSPIEVGVDRVWRFFTSVRNAVYEIVFLALLVLIGTLRGSEVPQWIADGIPALQPVVDRWYAWDTFRSPIFALTLAIIALAIMICTLNRIPEIWATISHPKVTTTSGFLRATETAATYDLAGSHEDVVTSFQDVVAKSRYRVLTEEADGVTHIYADKNRMSNLGTFPFHLGLILILVGGIVASVYGFRDVEFIVPEGTRRAVGHGTGLSVELNRFRDIWSEGGIPIDYTSQVTIYENGEPVREGDIRVNHPLSYGNATFYQSSFGNNADIAVTDANGSVVFSGQVDLGRFTKADNPDAPAGVIRLPNQQDQIVLVAPDRNPTNEPELDTLQLQSGEMWVTVESLGDSTAVTGDGNEGVVLTLGQPTQVGDYSVTFERESRFTALQVAYNPGIPIFIVASLALLGGLMITFYFPHRRIRGRIETTESGSRLQIAPLAKRDWSGKREFFQILGRLNARYDIKPDVRAPQNAGDYEYLMEHHD